MFDRLGGILQKPMLMRINHWNTPSSPTRKPEMIGVARKERNIHVKALSIDMCGLLMDVCGLMLCVGMGGEQNIVDACDMEGRRELTVPSAAMVHIGEKNERGPVVSKSTTEDTN